MPYLPSRLASALADGCAFERELRRAGMAAPHAAHDGRLNRVTDETARTALERDLGPRP